MNLSAEERIAIFERTDGRCYYCKKQLAYDNYGKIGARGSWEFDHKIPRSQGGSDEPSNLVAACVGCNRDKSDLSAVSYRRMTKPIRIERRNKAIKGDIESLGVPLSSFTIFGFWRLREWHQDRQRQKALRIAKPLTLRDLPWDAIILLALVVIILYLIFRAHRTT